jgi:sugar lactone lactonase YvrE
VLRGKRSIERVKAELLLDVRHELAEGPVWHAGFWWWVDIQGGTMNRCDLAGGGWASKPVGKRPGAAVPCADGRWLIAHEEGFGFFCWDTARLDTFDRRLAGQAQMRMNDGKCDPAGRFWAGSLHEGGNPGVAHLYCVEDVDRISIRLSGVSCSNGLAWSAKAGRMYYIDTGAGRIDVFDYAMDTGGISHRRTLATIPPEAGWPDGMAIDIHGNLWVALWGGGAVQSYDGTTGAVLARIDCGASQVTSCCFGGPKGDQLLITSAWQGFTASKRRAEPHAGSLWTVRPGVSGGPTETFAPCT